MYKDQLKAWKEKRQKVLEIYEAGIKVKEIARQLKCSEVWVYKMLKRARAER